MKDFYVYLHRRKDDDEVFYVGKGRGRRATNGSSGRSDHWMATVAQHGGFVMSYVAMGLDQQQAAVLEVQTIAHHLEIGSPLVNRKLLVRKRAVVGAGPHLLRNVITPCHRFFTLSEMVQFEACDPLELQSLFDGKIAVTNDGWIIGEKL